MNSETSIQGLLQKAYDSLKASDTTSAVKSLDEAIKIDYEHKEVLFALKCINWWQERMRRLPEFYDPFEKGGFILSQWKAFYDFLDLINESYEPCLYALRGFVFSMALDFFQGALGDGVNQHDPGILLQVGRCYKGAGNYEEALKYLEQAIRFRREDSKTLAELADVYALLEETKIAKVMFREAFFVDPQGIDLRTMESQLIIRLRDKVRSLGYEGEALAEWIPIYGELLRVFSVKRELKPIELGRLKQDIFSIETEIRSNRSRQAILKPRLLNKYFWLIDHYENTQEESALIEETLLKIKVLDTEIYERYINL